MKEKVWEILQNACALREDISETSELKMLSLDSLSFVGAVVELEEAFGISFDIDESGLFAWKTAGDVLDAVKEKINAKI